LRVLRIQFAPKRNVACHVKPLKSTLLHLRYDLRRLEFWLLPLFEYYPFNFIGRFCSSPNELNNLVGLAGSVAGLLNEKDIEGIKSLSILYSPPNSRDNQSLKFRAEACNLLATLMSIFPVNRCAIELRTSIR